MKIVFATNNAHKLAEVQAMVPATIELISLQECGVTEDIEESETTLEGNALLKARYIYGKTGQNCFADDTGLEVEALNGAPGVYSARYAKSHDSEANNALLMQNLAKLTTNEERKARFRTAIALIIDGAEYLFEGIVEGYIATEAKGDEWFGYDPIFVPTEPTNSAQKSFAEMSQEQKGAISHRGRATAKLVDFLGKI
ncbi:MAG: RdgB/HAM1 family non-canonical purine NTP pyrophosphatase [Rikenellaceae bacterium]